MTLEGDRLSWCLNSVVERWVAITFPGIFAAHGAYRRAPFDGMVCECDEVIGDWDTDPRWGMKRHIAMLVAERLAGGDRMRGKGPTGRRYPSSRVLNEERRK